MGISITRSDIPKEIVCEIDLGRGFRVTTALLYGPPKLGSGVRCGEVSCPKRELCRGLACVSGRRIPIPGGGFRTTIGPKYRSKL